MPPILCADLYIMILECSVVFMIMEGGGEGKHFCIGCVNSGLLIPVTNDLHNAVCIVCGCLILHAQTLPIF